MLPVFLSGQAPPGGVPGSVRSDLQRLLRAGAFEIAGPTGSAKRTRPTRNLERAGTSVLQQFPGGTPPVLPLSYSGSFSKSFLLTFPLAVYIRSLRRLRKKKTRSICQRHIFRCRGDNVVARIALPPISSTVHESDTRRGEKAELRTSSVCCSTGKKHSVPYNGASSMQAG